MPTAETSPLERILARLIDRKPVRSEATLQADVRQLLLDGGLNLDEHDLTVDLETQVGDGRRIDIEVGFTVIETKKDLRSPAVLRDAERQLGGYVRTRSQQVGQRYVGILTDGVDWRAYNLTGGQFALASRFEAKQRTEPAELMNWLEGVLATAEGIRPTPEAIAQKLGADTVSHQLDYTTLAALYEANKDLATVKLKRELWAQLLRSALGAQFEDSDELFIEHTLLVNTAEIIAHLVLGIPDVKNTSPATLVLGQLFERANVFGVVESDFFDWVIEVDDGESFVRTMARRISRFDWARVEHDVLKVLYESIIAPETRKKQGEYYTPDWLAEAMVAEVITDPLNQTVLDPSCGSGTFLFHAARRYLTAAEADGRPLRQVLDELTEHVAGIDLHPVAVALARVTYLLAIGRDRLAGERGPIHVPVFLGDSVQWQQRTDLFDQGHLVIRTDSGARLFHNELRFSEDLLQDAASFDRLINELADKAAHRPAGATPSVASMFNRLGIPHEHQAEIKRNFELLCRLVDEGRDHIWSYYVRNLARPMWLARTENRVNVLIGNPPWLSYRHMPAEMQDLFKEMSQDRHLWRGDEVATHQDLSGLFIARAVQQYLADGGTFAFVVPNPVLDRPYWQGFRAGNYPDPHEPIRVEFTGSWDLRRLRPHFFPRGSAVVFGRRMRTGVGTAGRAAGNPAPLPETTNRWTGKIPRAAADWTHVQQWITRQDARLRYVNEDLISSPYAPRFFQGATIVPRVLFFVKPRQAGPLGLGGGRVLVCSERSNTEKKPWKDLPDQEGVVESQFLRPVLLGESVLPYRLLAPRQAVLPIEGNSIILDSGHPNIERYPDFAKWWRRAEELWLAHRSSERLTLLEQLDFRRKLSIQLPGTSLRLVYGKAGMHVSAALVEDPNAVIDHKLYWGTVSTRQEGMYLCAILNSPALTEIVRPLMSYGKDERDIDKAVWQLPIPIFDPEEASHARLATIGESEAVRISALGLDESKNFVRLRQTVRSVLTTSPEAEELDQLVRLLLE